MVSNPKLISDVAALDGATLLIGIACSSITEGLLSCRPPPEVKAGLSRRSNVPNDCNLVVNSHFWLAENLAYMRGSIPTAVWLRSALPEVGCSWGL